MIHDLSIERLIREGAAQMEPISCKHSNTETRTIDGGQYTRCEDCGRILMTQTDEEIELATLQEENNALRLRIAQLEDEVARLIGPLDKETL